MNEQLHPVLSLPRDPIAVAEITAALIRADARMGQTMQLPESVRYALDTARAGNVLRSPAETARIGAGQCFDLTRAEGAFRGTHVGCVRTPIGFHVFLAFGQDEPIVYDVSRMRGMSEEPEYEGAAYAPIWPRGGGLAGHDQPPLGLSPQRPARYVSAIEKIGGYGAGFAIAGVGQTPKPGPRIVPKGSCPGSCAIQKRR